MTKPSTAEGYSNQVTENCERVLVTLLRGLGPWRDSIVLVGGLTPRYLIERKPAEIPAHAGTGDVDVVIQLQMLNETEAYHSLEDNFKKLGLTRGTNTKGQSVSWRWEISTGGTKVAIELLADDPDKSGGKVVELPTEGSVSAMNIPHSAIVFDHHKTRKISAELLGDDGVATVDLHYADLVAFVCRPAISASFPTMRTNVITRKPMPPKAPGQVQASVRPSAASAAFSPGSASWPFPASGRWLLPVGLPPRRRAQWQAR